MPSVLVVEDDEVVRGVWAFKLARAGFTVHEAPDGESGLAAAAAHRNDVVLLDWMLPNQSGLDVCRAMRDDEDLKTTPVIFVSARGEEFDIERAFAAGADDYLVKPISPSDLVDRVHAVLTRDTVAADSSGAELWVPEAPALQLPHHSSFKHAGGRRPLGRVAVSAAVIIGLSAGVLLESGSQAGGPGVPQSRRAPASTMIVGGSPAGPVPQSISPLHRAP